MRAQRLRQISRHLALACGLVVRLTRGAVAQGYPLIATQSLLEGVFAHTATRAQRSSNDLYVKIRQDIVVEWTPELALVGLARLEPVGPGGGGYDPSKRRGRGGMRRRGP
jgi:hypothetical protein